MRRYQLMIPGPVEIAPEIMAKMGEPLVAHYGAEWTRFFNETLDLLKRVMLTQEARIFPLVGSGSSGLDAAIANTAGDGKRILVLKNGFFGERFLEIALSHVPAENVKLVEAPIGEPLAPDRVDEVLAREKDVRVVAVVHCETSTGVLNPLREISEVCRRHDALVVVDAITSLGGAELCFDEWGLDVLVGSTQKCLGVPPGIAPVAVSGRAWAVIEQTMSPGWYLDFKTWQRYADEWSEWHPHPVTIPSGLMSALHLSLSRLLEEGLEACWARHRRNAQLFRQGLRNLGFEIVSPEAFASPTVTAAWTPDALPVDALIEALKERHGVQISGALGELKGRAFRVGHMGETARAAPLLSLLLAIEDVMRASGLKVAPGQSLKDLDLDIKG